MRGRPLLSAGAAVGGLALVLPASASAHGIVGRRDLPIPEAAFFWTAVGVLVVSFLALALLWQHPLLQDPAGRLVIRLPPAVTRACEILLGAIGVGLFVLVVWAGLAGIDSPTANITPTAVFVLFWVGLVPVSVLFGDVFRAISPWRAVGRSAGWLAARLSRRGAPEPIAYPSWLGYWPAATGLLAFAWVELVYSERDKPAVLAVLALLYAGAQLLGMALFGVERWTARGDAFGVYFSLFARLSPVRWARDGLWLGKPLASIFGLPVATGMVALVCVMIGTTAFDGASQGPLWTGVAPDLQRSFTDLGLGPNAALEATFTVGLVAAVLIVGLIYAGGVAGMRAIVPGQRGVELARAFMPTLVPIALAYVIAHYASLLIYNGQATGYLISDPLGHGSNLFGTATLTIDYGVVSATGIWYVQVIALVLGHVAALALAHDRALARWPDVRQATLSQMWMLIVMVGFTVLGLYLLSAAS